MVLNPFPPGTFGIAIVKLLMLFIWLCWGAVLGCLLAPKLVSKEEVSLLAWAVGKRPMPRSTENRVLKATQYLWVVAPALHVVLVWGSAILCQRPGYTASMWQGMQAKFGCHSNSKRHTQQRDWGLAATLGTSHASCAADPAIDALFYPAANLVMDRKRALLNVAMWVAAIALKVAFEFWVVMKPTVTLIGKVGGAGWGLARGR